MHSPLSLVVASTALSFILKEFDLDQLQSDEDESISAEQIETIQKLLGELKNKQYKLVTIQYNLLEPFYSCCSVSKSFAQAAFNASFCRATLELSRKSKSIQYSIQFVKLIKLCAKYVDAPTKQEAIAAVTELAKSGSEKLRELCQQASSALQSAP